MLELADQRILQLCGFAAVACMWLIWGDVTVQALIDHKHAR